MKAVVFFSYGSPEVLKCVDIERPLPGPNEVLIKVRAASINPLDCGELKGLPLFVRLIFGLRKPSVNDPGRPRVDVAGQVESVGEAVTQFKAGDDLFGMCLSDPSASGTKAWMHSQGSFAEYACLPAAALVLKPANVTFEEAASVPVAALTALQGLRDKGRIRPGQKVLIHGAGGGVGTFAVQIAKWLGAEVTAVSGPGNLDMLRSLGADKAIDYTREDFTETSRRYDAILDCYGSRPSSRCRRILSSRGIYVGVGGPAGSGLLIRLLEILVISWFGSRKMVTFLAKPK